MKEGEIKIISSDQPFREGLTELDKQFIEKEHLTRNDIREMAGIVKREIDDVLQEVGPIPTDVATAFIVNILSSEQIAKVYYRSTGELLFREVDQDKRKAERDELENLLSVLRRAIAEELMPLLPEEIRNTVHIIERFLSFRRPHSNPSVMKLLDGSIFKATPYWEEDAKMTTIQRVRALRHLYALHDKGIFSPYILYLGKMIGEYTGAMLQEKRRFITLEQLLSDKDRRPRLSLALQYYLDALKGLQFLLDHQLVLADLSLDNVAILDVDGHQRVGALFDFDGLYSASDQVRVYPSHGGHRSPESSLSEVILESHLIFDLGVSLRELSRVYYIQVADTPLDDTYVPLETLILHMINNNPETRPTVQECITTLESIIKNLETV